MLWVALPQNFRYISFTEQTTPNQTGEHKMFDAKVSPHLTIAVPLVTYSCVCVKVPEDFDLTTQTSEAHPDFDFWGAIWEWDDKDDPKHDIYDWYVQDENFLPTYFEEREANEARGITTF
jgi:hypothetical protein